MTTPVPGPLVKGRARRTQRYGGLTEAEALEIEARRHVHVGMLPAARVDPDLAGPVQHGDPKEADARWRGWTAQQPWVHVDADVLHLCVLCAGVVHPDQIRQHDCPVTKELTQ